MFNPGPCFSAVREGLGMKVPFSIEYFIPYWRLDFFNFASRDCLFSILGPSWVKKSKQVKTFRRSYRAIPAGPTPPTLSPSKPLPSKPLPTDLLRTWFRPGSGLKSLFSSPNRVEIRSKLGTIQEPLTRTNCLKGTGSTPPICTAVCPPFVTLCLVASKL